MTTSSKASSQTRPKVRLVSESIVPSLSVADVTAFLPAGREGGDQGLLFFRLNQAAMPDKLTLKETP